MWYRARDNTLTALRAKQSSPLEPIALGESARREIERHSEGIAQVDAIREQLEKHLHLCFAVTPYESYVAVAEKLNALAPGNFPKKTILVNSGAEAIENSVKIARAYTKRPAVICFEDAFHGRTLLTMSLTSKTHPYKAGFQPFASDIYRIPFAYPYRAEKGATAGAMIFW